MLLRGGTAQMLPISRTAQIPNGSRDLVEAAGASRLTAAPARAPYDPTAATTLLRPRVTAGEIRPACLCGLAFRPANLRSLFWNVTAV